MNRLSFKLTICFFGFVLAFGSKSYSNQPDTDCVTWFENSKIKKNTKSCETDCSALMVDMGTFMCPNQCDLLCKTIENSNPIGKFLFYPGLTPNERTLTEKYPKESMIVFIQKTRAEWSSSKYFPEQNLNDEGDAFRHFIWSGLLTKELGTERAKEFLDAHEADLEQPKSEFEMDTHNNNLGQKTAESIIKQNNWSIENSKKKELNYLKIKS